MGEEPARPESEGFIPEYDAGSDDGFDGTGHIPDYIDTSTHIRTILERWPTEIWSDDDNEEEEEDDDDDDGDYLTSTIDLNPFLFDSDRSSQPRYPTLSSRRVIDPDQDDHLWSPSSLADLSLNVDVWNESPRSASSLSHTLDEWHESPTSDLSPHLYEWNESGSDSSIQYLGATNDYQHPFYDASARIVTASRHLDQPFYDDMDIE